MEGRPGLLDLEKELVCSICTEILYQPLTLLDCLHTFCGACVKEWFQSQARGGTSSRTNPYTCPSCRSSVRGTRHDAKISTLLDMFITVNPDKARSAEDISERNSIYTPGENVTPALAGRHHDRDSIMSDLSRADRLSGRLDHQASLISLMSNSDVGANDLEEEILRQIHEEHLLDDVDWDDMDQTQVDALSERLAEAYRRRRGGRQDSITSSIISQASNASRLDRRLSQIAQSIIAAEPTEAATEIIPRQNVARNVNAERRQHPRIEQSAVDHHLNVRSPQNQRAMGDERPPRPTTEAQGVSRQFSASRSDADLSNPASRRHAQPQPGTVLPRSNLANELNNSVPAGQISTTERVEQPTSPPQTTANRQESNVEEDHPDTTSPGPPPVQRGLTYPSANDTRSPALARQTSDPSTSTIADRNASTASPRTIGDPPRACYWCSQKTPNDHRYEHCDKCNNGHLDICHRCYRLGKGCEHWFGFGRAARKRFLESATQQSPPHVLHSRMFARQLSGIIVSLQGLFCFGCMMFCDQLFWQCNTCNSGEWGFCDRCVSDGMCCTHPLLPIRNSEFVPPVSAINVSEFVFPPTYLNQDKPYDVVQINTSCSRCKRQILTDTEYEHCYVCKADQRDLCRQCSTVLASNTMHNNSGSKYVCSDGHVPATIIVRTGKDGPRRVVLFDPTIHQALQSNNRGLHPQQWIWFENGTQKTSRKSDAQSRSINKQIEIAYAKHAWIPKPGDADELNFPRGADIVIIDELQPEWWVGIYAGHWGVFPSAYVAKRTSTSTSHDA